jgi:hypothetical protein
MIRHGKGIPAAAVKGVDPTPLDSLREVAF